jgi:hypothetical protein
MNMLQTLGTGQVGTGTSDRRRRRERRQAKRLDARGAAVSVSLDGGVEAALCGDISQNGIRLSLDRPMAVGEVVTVSLDPQLTLTGRVAWVDQAECGIAFDHLIEAAAEADLPAISRDRRQASLATFRNESRFRDGLSVTVVLPDCERKAVLRWTDDDFASLTLKP